MACAAQSTPLPGRTKRRTETLFPRRPRSFPVRCRSGLDGVSCSSNLAGLVQMHQAKQVAVP